MEGETGYERRRERFGQCIIPIRQVAIGAFRVMSIDKLGRELLLCTTHRKEERKDQGDIVIS